MKRAALAVSAAALACAPAVAEACPYCAGGNGDSVGQSIAMAAMVASPFVAVGVGVTFIVRMIRKEQSDE